MTTSENSVIVHYVTTYDPKHESMGGGSWVDRKVLEAIEARFSVRVHPLANEWGSDGLVKLELVTTRDKLRTSKRLLMRREPYFAAKFRSDVNWSSLRASIYNEIDSDRDLVITSQFPALLAAMEGGVVVDAHIAHNVDAVLSDRYDPWALRALRNANKMRALEASACRSARRVWAVSRKDAHSISEWGVDVAHLPLARVLPPRRLTRVGRIGFMGKGSWPPNASAIDVMVSEVLPRVRSALGSETPEFVLAGKRTEAWKGKAGVHVLGEVVSASRFYAGVDLVAVPRLGVVTGVSVKMLEAIDNQATVIVPRSLAHDAGLTSGYIAADTAPEMADAIVAFYTQRDTDADRPQAGEPVAGDPFDPFLSYLRERASEKPASASGHCLTNCVSSPGKERDMKQARLGD